MRSIQPKASEDQVSLHIFSRTSAQTYEIALDVVDDFTTPRDSKRGSLGDIEVDAVHVPYVRELNPSTNLEHELGGQYISLHPRNKITCDGPLPTFNIPAPYNETGDFENLQQLCAVQLSGGLM